MGYYRLFHITAGGSFCNSQDIRAHDDAAAMEVARHITPTGEAELWCGKRLVRVFELVEADVTVVEHGAPPAMFGHWDHA